MQNKRKTTPRALVLAGVLGILIAALALAACGGVPANVQPTIQAAAQTAQAVAPTVQAAVTNIAPTVQAAAQTAQAQVTQLAPTVQAIATTVAPTVAAVATQAAGGQPSGTLTYASNIDDIVSLDPAIAYEFSGVVTDHNVYEGLVQFIGSDLANLKPALADKWDIKDAGDKWELTFTLRDGAKFSTGNPVTADDVVFSIQRAIALNKSPAFLYIDIAKLTQDSVVAKDPKTVVITMPKDASPQALLTIFTFTLGGIVDSKEAKAHEKDGDFGSGWLLDHSAGTGPYMIDHWTKDVEVLLKANPNASVQPKLAQVLIKHIPESNNQQSQLEKGDVDVAQNLTPEQIGDVTKKPGVTFAKGNSLLLFYVGMNVTVKPLDNEKVREAIRTVIDYDGITKDLLSGNGTKWQTVIPNGLLGANPDAPFQQDIEAAKALLKEAGVEGGFEIELGVPTGAAPGGVAWADLAAKVQSDLDQVGIKANIKQVAQAELLTNYRAQKGQLTMILWGPDFPDPDANVGPWTDYAAKSIAYRNAWDDKDAAAQGRAAALETDPAKRAAAYKTLTDYILHKGPYAVLYQPTQLFALRDNVKGFEWNPMGYADFWTISK
ncbi:MAG: ABC transporter substrate-binding protein [Chloroflexi bacterium]|nr:ABC transporter substrate-binding protein [Chloroflexota bacterium]